MRYAHALVMSDIWDKKISDLNLDFTKDVFENTSPSQPFIDDIFNLQKYNNQALSVLPTGRTWNKRGVNGRRHGKMV
jgi:hypothetical protein